MPIVKFFFMAFDTADEILNNKNTNSKTIKDITPVRQNTHVKLGIN